MKKRIAFYAIALFAYPPLFLLGLNLRSGLPTAWFPWTARTLIIGLVTLTLLWFVRAEKSVKALLYIALMTCGGFLFSIWMNKRGIASPTFGWEGMLSVLVVAAPILSGAAILVVLLLLPLRHWAEDSPPVDVRPNSRPSRPSSFRL